tara:strand:+ start:1499 stop:1768 length:270 start_codon:yes stop_codon:yes gene_type:complete
MNVFLKIKEDNFKDKNLVPRSFQAEIKGSQVLTIKELGNNKAIEFYYDVKNTIFTEEELLLEGFISNSNQLIGRCVFNVNPSQAHITDS